MNPINTKKPRFLLIDDDPLIQDTYRNRFASAGIELVELSNVDGDFIQKITDLRPDVIMLDIHFEEFVNNGVIAAEALQLDKRTSSIPIIFLTNGDIEDLAIRAKKVTSSLGFIIKASCTPEEVLNKVLELYSDYLKKKTT